MASRKIIFLIIVGLLSVATIIGIVSLANKQQAKKTEKVPSLSIWVVGGTTEEYQTIFDGFKQTAPEYKNTILDIRVFPDYKNYHDILLSTLADGAGPDVFMIEAGGDDILASKSAAIPSDYIDISNFDKQYEDIFLPLLISEGEGKNLTRSLKGAPLGYETLGVFYNKSYFPTVPRTWNEVQTLYSNEGGVSFFPTNLGLGPIYTPYATDIIAYFMALSSTTETKNLETGSAGMTEYLSYGKAPISTGTDEGVVTSSLIDMRGDMDTEALTTVDLFMRGKIGMLIGYPSLVRDIEKAEKRAGTDAIDDIILTERLPGESLGKDRINIARYRYLALSNKTEKPIAGAAFLGYLMTEPALLKVQEVFPYLISPQRGLYTTQSTNPLSKLFARTRLDVFIPEAGEKLTVFGYGLKSEYEKIFGDYIDRNDKIDINKILNRIKNTVECKVESSASNTLSEKCTQSDEL